jgi:hypothetical protein
MTNIVVRSALIPKQFHDSDCFHLLFISKSNQIKSKDFLFYISHFTLHFENLFSEIPKISTDLGMTIAINPVTLNRKSEKVEFRIESASAEQEKKENGILN